MKKKFLRMWHACRARVLPSIYQTNAYTLYRYHDGEGKFNYARYKKVQIAGNKKKLHMVWALEENIRYLTEWIRKNVGQPQFGLCHGTRRWVEQSWFREMLGCDVIGTEISETAKNFPYTIQWDFPDVREEWRLACDFIYSNAFDHTYDPKKCLNAWMACLRRGGVCIIEHSSSRGMVPPRHWILSA